jgi:hypothetical protein
MQGYLRILFLLGIIILFTIHWYAFPLKEGFFDVGSDYENLKIRLKNELGDYCATSEFVRSQIQQMQQMTGGSAEDNNKIYEDVYTCKDSLASSRPSCIFPNFPNRTGMKYEPCSTFLNLPKWSNNYNTLNALINIKNDLPERIIRETEWFDAFIKKLQDGINAGANPPLDAPSMDQLNQYEGFESVCSPEAAAIKEALKCVLPNSSRESSIPDTLKIPGATGMSAVPEIPSISIEIARINGLLNNPIIKSSVSKCKAQKISMLKLQSDLEKAKNGTLYEWQKDPPKVSLPVFQGGDRSQSFIFSLKQNQ